MSADVKEQHHANNGKHSVVVPPQKAGAGLLCFLGLDSVLGLAVSGYVGFALAFGHCGRGGFGFRFESVLFLSVDGYPSFGRRFYVGGFAFSPAAVSAAANMALSQSRRPVLSVGSVRTAPG